MKLFSEFKRHLEPRRFENSESTYYFGKGNELYLIEQPNGGMTYAAYDDNLKPVIITDLDKYTSVSMEVPFERIFVVPSYNKLRKIEKIEEMFPLIPENLFFVIDYGMLEDNKFKGALFSKSLINVTIMNGKGEIYEIRMLVGDGVRGMDGNPHGTISGAYNFSPICGKKGKYLYINPMMMV